MHAASTRIFISYQRASADTALRIRDILTDAGYTVWLDTDQIRHTDRWPVAVNQALEEADSMILLLTQAANESREVFNEWFYFYKNRKPLHVIRLDDSVPHYQLLSLQRLDWNGRIDDEWPRLVAELLAALRPTGNESVSPAPETVVTTPLAPPRSVTSTLHALYSALLHPDKPVALRPEQLDEIQLHQARDLRDYYLACYSRWCGPEHRLDRQFVRLNLIYDEGPGSPDRWIKMPSVRESDDLNEILTSSSSFAYVLLGAPGSGKTTLLRRLEMDVARIGVTNPDPRSVVPFSVSLAEFGLGHRERAPNPLEWLQHRWSTRNPQLPELRRLLDDGRILLIVDGLNELAHHDATDLRRRVDAWRAFLYEEIRDIPGNRAIFSCRTLEYGAMLSSKDVGVPHIRLEPMTESQVLGYIDLHLPDHAELAREVLLRDPRTLSFYRTPYMLRLLVSQVHAIGTIPVGRTDAFAAMIRELLRREILAGNQRLINTEILTEREQRRLRDGVRDPRWLPNTGSFIPALTRLAYQMQSTKLGAEKGNVVVTYDTAIDLLNGLARIAEASLHVGFDTGILDEHEETIRFFHQLLQEFFAARQLGAADDLSQLAVPTRVDQVTPALSARLDDLAVGEPLPPLTTTGWEETAVMAAAMTADPDGFVRQVLAVNPALAGRCLAAPDVDCSEAVHLEVAGRLLASVFRLAVGP
ncbi:hypothetical protein Acsp02_97510 [Actinoplanes sp. NBRC 103695]|nr:TIR domain-containing protein [Actinoplanes sp. NBRC 103695]GLZ02500.1 hypothetical protein Acsp02_97510 [Actinoplanes sp. NBRC 103695]